MCFRDLMHKRKWLLPCNFLVIETMTHHLLNEQGAALRTTVWVSAGWALLRSPGELPGASTAVVSVPRTRLPRAGEVL